MNNKSKYHQPVKVEKENENINLRKRTKSLITDTYLTNRKKTVWDRLSKIKKVSSSEKCSEESNLHPNFLAKSHERIDSIDNTLLKSFKNSSKKPLIPYNNFVKKQNCSRNTSVKKSEIIRDLENEILLYDLPIDEIITSRSVSSVSKYSTENVVDSFQFRKGHNDTLCYIDRKQKEFSETSIEEYTLAPLLLEDGTQNNVEKCLRSNNKRMELRDSDVVINVVKSEGKYELKKDNPKPLKDILKTQVENILSKEFAVEKDFNNLESSVNLQQRFKEDLSHKKEIKKFEIDVIFKNVPSLDKEIKILRALGEKLEDTLKSTRIYRNRQTSISQISINSISEPFEVLQNSNALPMFKVKHDYKIEHFALVLIQPNGIRQHVGLINEFSVAKKTIVELKREQNRQFFIPSNCENIQLLKTSFKYLKENPNELFRHVRPNNSRTAFNVLEQDPIFFYSALSKLSKSSYYSLRHQTQNNEHLLAIDEDKYKNCLIKENESKIMIDCNFNSNRFYNLDNNLFKIQSEIEPIIRGKKRRRIRHLVTPMPIGYNHCPKNFAIKTILVGFVQVFLFIGFIVALTHPGLRCLN